MKNDKPSERKERDKKPRVGEILEVTITEMDPEGFGVGTLPDGPVLVNGALPGEMVRAKVAFAGKRDVFADTIKVLRHSPDRLTKPPCSKAGSCDGCPLITMKYSAQLSWKQALVGTEVKRYRALAAARIHDILPSPKQLNYRNSAKLVITGKFSDPVIGIYRRNSHDVADIGDCPLHHPLIKKVIDAVRQGITRGKVPIFSPRSNTGFLRYVVVRVAEEDNRAMVVFVTAERSFNEIHHLAKHVRAMVPEVAVAAQNVNTSSGNAIFGDRDFFITPRKELSDRIGDVRFAISPRSFFQINSGGARIIYEKVKEWAGLTGRETVLDLYCGVGGISLFLAKDAREVIGIEAVEPAVADAETNARLNRSTNCTFAAGDAAEMLETLKAEERHVDVIVLNPPRKGCDEQVLKVAALLAPARMVYVSCSPRTLARDLDQLSRLGYQTTDVQPVDMFPQTPHVENVALLERMETHRTQGTRNNNPPL